MFAFLAENSSTTAWQPTGSEKVAKNQLDGVHPRIETGGEEGGAPSAELAKRVFPAMQHDLASASQVVFHGVVIAW